MEFDLDAPTLSRDTRSAFRYQTRFVTALFERSFKKFVRKEKVWKVLVEVVPKISELRILNLGGVLILQIKGNPELLLHAELDQKGPISLDWLDQGAMKVAETYNWPVANFHDAASSVIAAEFRYRRQWKKALWNRTRTVQGAIVIVLEPYKAHIMASFTDARKESLGEVELCSTLPSEFLFVPRLGKLKWLDNRRLALLSRIDKERWVARVPAR